MKTTNLHSVLFNTVSILVGFLLHTHTHVYTPVVSRSPENKRSMNHHDLPYFLAFLCWLLSSNYREWVSEWKKKRKVSAISFILPADCLVDARLVWEGGGRRDRMKRWCSLAGVRRSREDVGKVTLSLVSFSFISVSQYWTQSAFPVTSLTCKIYMIGFDFKLVICMQCCCLD